MNKLPIQIFKDEKAPCFALLAAVIQQYRSNDVDPLDWDPAILRDTIESDFNFKLPNLQHDKIQSAIVALKTDSVETDPRMLEQFCSNCANESDDFETFEPVEVEVLAAGLAELFMIKESIHDFGKDGSLQFSDDVKRYVGMILWDAGFMEPPKIFQHAAFPDTVNIPEKTPERMRIQQEKDEAFEEAWDGHVNYVLKYCGVEA